MNDLDDDDLTQTSFGDIDIDPTSGVEDNVQDQELSLDDLMGDHMNNNMNFREDITGEAVVTLVDALADKWEITGSGDQLSVDDAQNALFDNFKTKGDPLLQENPSKGIQMVLEDYMLHRYGLVNLCYLVKKHVAIEEQGEIRKKLKQTIRGMRYAYDAISARIRFMFMMKGENPDNLSDEAFNVDWGMLSILDSKNEEKRTPLQKFLIYVLEQAMQKGYRRMEGDVYTARLTQEGYNTHSWERIMSLREFVYKEGDKDISFEAWENLTANPNNWKYTETYLENSNDTDFPRVVPNRMFFSFRDGVYSVTDDKFYKYGGDIPSNTTSVKYHDCNIQKVDEYTLRYYASLPELVNSESDVDEIVREYQDTGELPDDLDELLHPDTGDWYHDIRTPAVDRIFLDQDLDEDTIRWCYAFLGRMLYPVGENDRWQVCMFMKGVGGCGKSTICNLIRSLYPSHLVGNISSNLEKKFGLGAIYKTLVNLCSEVKLDFALTTGEMQQMVSGENVSVAIKNKTAKDVKWSAPLLLAGNEVPHSWVNDAGQAIARRVVVIDMPNAPKRSDPFLNDKLNACLGHFLRKINKAYKDKCANFANKDIWGKTESRKRTRDGNLVTTEEFIMPKQIISAKKRFTASIDGLSSFLDNPDIVEHAPDGRISDYYVSMKDFQTKYNLWRREMNQPKVTWNEDYYEATFKKNKLLVRRDRLHYKGREQHTTFIIGIRLFEEEEENVRS